jgi:uncharacterized protein (TIGR02217 family)
MTLLLNDLLPFPELKCAKFATQKRTFNTDVFETPSGNEARNGYMNYPKITFNLSTEAIVDNRDEEELKLLLGFMLQMQGKLNSFLYSHYSDCSIIDYQIGAGDGANKQFQLKRDYGGFIEPIENIASIKDIKINGSPINSYTVNDTGLIEFTNAPINHAVITATADYYYQVRFIEDGYDFEQMFEELHSCQDITFIGKLQRWTEQ